MNVTGLDWGVLLAIVLVLFALDLLVATLRPHAVGFREAAAWSAFFVTAAVGFGAALGGLEGWGYAGQFFAGYFGLGESPTGSRDPYGLRRAGQGAVRAVLDFWRPKAGEKAPDLEALVADAAQGYKGLKQAPDVVAKSVAAFLLDRLAYVLTARGYAADEVAAVAEAPGALADPIDALQRVEALQRVRRERPDDFAALAEPFKRAKNIVAQAAPGAAIDPKLFEADAVRGLYEAVSRLGTDGGAYEERLRALAELRAPIARFFDDVLVMAEDARVRANRLALLQKTLSHFYRIADISRLGGTS